MSSKGSLKGRFENYGAAPNANAWAGISAALPAKKSKKAIIWWLFAGSGVAASLVFAFFALNTNPIQTDGFSDVEITPQELEKPIVADHIIEEDNSSNGDTNTAENSVNVDIRRNRKTDISLIENGQNTTKNGVKKSDFNLAKNSNSLIKNNDLVTASTVVPKGAVLPTKKQFQSQKGLAQEPFSETDVSFISPELDTKPKTVLIAKEIDLLAAQNTPLVASVTQDMFPKKMEEFSDRKGSWQWGGKVGTSYALRGSSANLSYDAFTNSALAVDSGEAIFFDLSLPTTIFSSVNRPISAAYLVRYSPVQRLFFQIEPTFNMVSALSSSNWNTQASTAVTKARFFSIGSDIKVGFKIINRKRWAVDIGSGIHFEKLLSNAPYIEKNEGVYLFGSLAEVGLNYNLTENFSLRLAPEFNRIHGNAQSAIETYLKRRSNLGINFSVLREF